MRILDRLRSEVNSLPPAVAWLAAGPEQTRFAVIAAKRKMLLVQAPIAFGSIAIFSILHSIGVVEAKGHLQLVAHFCAAAAFMWPPTLFYVCLAAKRDISNAPPQLRKQLRALFLASCAISVLSAITLSAVAIVYAHTMLNL